MMTILKTIDKIGQSKVRGVAFHGTQREDESGLNNAEVAEDLAKRGWDFFSAGDFTDDIVESFVKVADTELQKQADKFAKIAKSQAKRRAKNPSAKLMDAEQIANRVATQIASTAFLKAGNVWRNEIIERIERGLLADGSKAKKVSKAYAEWRQEKYGIPKSDVGVASADLLTNLADDKALRLKR